MTTIVCFLGNFKLQNGVFVLAWNAIFWIILSFLLERNECKKAFVLPSLYAEINVSLSVIFFSRKGEKTCVLVAKKWQFSAVFWAVLRGAAGEGGLKKRRFCGIILILYA